MIHDFMDIIIELEFLKQCIRHPQELANSWGCLMRNNQIICIAETHVYAKEDY